MIGSAATGLFIGLGISGIVAAGFYLLWLGFPSKRD